MARPRCTFSRSLAVFALISGYLLMLMPLAESAATAQTTFKLKPILQLGGMVGNTPIGDHFDVGKLNDRGQLAFVTGNEDGDEILVQYSDGKLIPILKASYAEELLRDHVVHGGMEPRLVAAVSAVREGVRSVHIIDGSVPNALLLELLTAEGVGTAVRSDVSNFFADTKAYLFAPA